MFSSADVNMGAQTGLEELVDLEGLFHPHFLPELSDQIQNEGCNSEARNDPQECWVVFHVEVGQPCNEEEHGQNSQDGVAIKDECPNCGIGAVKSADQGSLIILFH